MFIFRVLQHPSSQVMISAGRQGSFFVAMGVMTLFYCLIAEIVYVVTMASAERLGRVYDFLVYMVSVLQWTTSHWLFQFCSCTGLWLQHLLGGNVVDSCF